MARGSPSFKPRHVVILALVALAGVSIWLNPSRPPPEKADAVLPPIDAADEAGRLLQQASENYFYREFEKGAENYRKAIAIYESENKFEKMARVYESMGDLYKFANEPGEAEASYLMAAEIHQKIHNIMGQARAQKNLGDLFIGLEDMEPAGKWYREAALLVSEEAPHPDKAVVLEALGQYYWKTGAVANAIDQFSQAKETFAALNHRMGVEHMTNVIAVLQKKRPPTAHGSGRNFGAGALSEKPGPT